MTCSNDAERIEFQVGCMEALRDKGQRVGLLRWSAQRRGTPRGGLAVSDGGLLRRGAIVPRKEPLELVDVAEPVLVVPGQVLVDATQGVQAVDVLQQTTGRSARHAVPTGPSTLIELDGELPVIEAVEVLRNRDVRASANHAAAHSGRSKGGSSPKKVDAPPASPRTADSPISRAPLVVIIDTGIDLAALGRAEENRRDHWLDGVLVRSSDDIDLLDTENVDGEDEPDGYLDLGAGHGTFVAGVVRRFAPTARIVVVRALETDGYGTEAAIQEAIARASCLFAATPGPGVLNLSLGIESIDGHKSLRGLEPVGIGNVINALPDDVAVVAAAGNGATGLPVWPAAFDRVLAVGSLSGAGQPSSWSNYGDWIDFAMVGEGVVSTFVVGEETLGSGADNDPFDPAPDNFEGPDPYAIWSGTSFATAKVTGRLAASLADRTNDLDEAIALLRRSGTAIEGYGVALEDEPLG